MVKDMAEMRQDKRRPDEAFRGRFMFSDSSNNRREPGCARVIAFLAVNLPSILSILPRYSAI